MDEAMAVTNKDVVIAQRHSCETGKQPAVTLSDYCATHLLRIHKQQRPPAKHLTCDMQVPLEGAGHLIL